MFACCHEYLPIAGLQTAGELTMVLDFGSFILDSDASAAADLPAEEAALYMGFKLSARNISSFFVDGDFDWALLRALESPKLQQTGAPCANLSCTYCMLDLFNARLMLCTALDTQRSLRQCRPGRVASKLLTYDCCFTSRSGC